MDKGFFNKKGEIHPSTKLSTIQSNPVQDEDDSCKWDEDTFNQFLNNIKTSVDFQNIVYQIDNRTCVQFAQFVNRWMRDNDDKEINFDTMRIILDKLKNQPLQESLQEITSQLGLKSLFKDVIKEYLNVKKQLPENQKGARDLKSAFKKTLNKLIAEKAVKELSKKKNTILNSTVQIAHPTNFDESTQSNLDKNSLSIFYEKRHFVYQKAYDYQNKNQDDIISIATLLDSDNKLIKSSSEKKDVFSFHLLDFYRDSLMIIATNYKIELSHPFFLFISKQQGTLPFELNHMSNLQLNLCQAPQIRMIKLSSKSQCHLHFDGSDNINQDSGVKLTSIFVLKGWIILGVMSPDKHLEQYRLEQGDMICLCSRALAYEQKEFDADKTMLLLTWCHGDIDVVKGI